MRKIVAIASPPTEHMFSLPPFVMEREGEHYVYGMGKILRLNTWGENDGTLLLLSRPLDLGTNSPDTHALVWMGHEFVKELTQLNLGSVLSMLSDETVGWSHLPQARITLLPKIDVINARQDLLNQVCDRFLSEKDPEIRSGLVSLGQDFCGGATDVSAMAWALRDGSEGDQRTWNWLKRLASDRGDIDFVQRSEKRMLALIQAHSERQ